MKINREAGSAAAGICLLSLIIIFLSGCSVLTKEIGRPVPPEEADLKEGETQVGDVIDKLGPPNHLTSLSGGIAFLYEYVDIKETQIGLNFEADVFQWFKFSLASSTGRREALVLIFDENGLLTGREFYKWRENLGKGAGVAFIIGARSLVDTSHLEEEPGALSWGAYFLKPLPEVLNAAQDLETGQSGFEQRGTTTKTGQHTLEMR